MATDSKSLSPSRMLLRSLVLCALLVGAMLASQHSPQIKAGDSSGVVMDLPTTPPGLISNQEDPDPIELRELPDDTEFCKRVYYTPTENPEKMDVVRCSIVLSGAERKSIHRPEKCLVAQGWTVAIRQVIPIRIDKERELLVTDLSIERPQTLKNGTVVTLSAHYVYWFIGSGVTTPSHASRSVITLMDNIFRNVNHRWAYASVMAFNTDNIPIEEVGQRPRDSDQTLELITKVITGIVPHFQKDFIPPQIAED